MFVVIIKTFVLSVVLNIMVDKGSLLSCAVVVAVVIVVVFVCVFVVCRWFFLEGPCGGWGVY